MRDARACAQEDYELATVQQRALEHTSRARRRTYLRWAGIGALLAFGAWVAFARLRTRRRQ